MMKIFYNLTNIDSFMLQKIKTTMRKNVSRNNYTIDIKADKEIDDQKFHQNKRGALVCDVIVMFEDSFKELENTINNLENEIDNKNKTIESLENRLSAIDDTHSKKLKDMSSEYYASLDSLKDKMSAKDDKLKQIELKYQEEISSLKEDYLNKINTLEKNHTKEILKLNNDISELKQNNQKVTFENESSIIAEKQKNIDNLKDEISEMKINHERTINKYKDTLIKLRTKDHHDTSIQHKKLANIKHEFETLGFFDKHFKRYNNLISDFNEYLEESEKINENKLLNTYEDFEKHLLIKKNEIED